jgi:hypothetical protein
MRLLLGKSKLGLERDQLVALRDGRGVRVACLTGALWVTQERSKADVILERGQSLVVEHAGLTLITALRSSTLRVCEPRVASLWRALTTWLRSVEGAPTTAS